ncbi:MAG: hypothetical protein NTX28_07820 [Novosphingobium sp.]|nr:hypothetical protein [Novosphingobium sp.]
MKTVLLLGGPAAGQQVEAHGTMKSLLLTYAGVPVTYNVVPMCSHGEVHWFGVLDGADPLALLIAGYAPVATAPKIDPRPYVDRDGKSIVDAALAAIAYDKAIQGCADNPDAMFSYCTAQGETLDSLYADWIAKSRAVLGEYGVKP